MQNNDILKELDNSNLTKEFEIKNTSQEINEDVEFEKILQELNDLDNTNIIKSKNKFISSILFILKYVSTSSLIFLVLLVSTNYSAYYQILQNYLNHEELQIESQWIISSVEASNIKEKFKEELIEEKELIENEDKQKTSDYSIKELINISNKNDISLDIEITPYENRIVIPKIGKNVPLVDIINRKIEGEDELNNIFMQELENWVIRYPWSSTPWNDWTTFIFWHSSNFPWIKWDYNDVFALLDKVEFDDEIIIYYNQKNTSIK